MLLLLLVGGEHLGGLDRQIRARSYVDGLVFKGDIEYLLWFSMPKGKIC